MEVLDRMPSILRKYFNSWNVKLNYPSGIVGALVGYFISFLPVFYLVPKQEFIKFYAFAFVILGFIIFAKSKNKYIKKIGFKFTVITFLILVILIGLYLKAPNNNVPNGMREKALELSEQYEDDFELLNATYVFVSERFTSKRMGYIFEPLKIFSKDIEKIWNQKNEFQPCGAQAYTFKRLLELTDRFEKNEIKAIHTFSGITPHLHIEVLVNGEKINVDVWGRKRNIPLGTYYPFYESLK